MDPYSNRLLEPVIDDEILMDFDVNQIYNDSAGHLSEHRSYDGVSWDPRVDPGLDGHTSGSWQSFDCSAPTHQFTHFFPPTHSVRSSQSSNARSSGSSVFSHQHWRDSTASTSTTWSHFSGTSREHNISRAERTLTANASINFASDATSRSEPARDLSQMQTHRIPSNNKKEDFSTCISRTKRSRRSTKEPRYWCTSCEEGFGEKYDWKRHEETYQERTETYQCDNCKKRYHLEKDFIHHHQNSHRCLTCVENHHPELALHRRAGRSGWGCGFCLRYDRDWTERCNHVAWHFEKNGDTMENWKQTQVILSLLRQPIIKQAWERLLDIKNETDPSFYYKKHKTGRAEGYPDSSRPPQLQDYLEFFTPEQDPTFIVHMAYDLGHRSSQSSPNSSHTRITPSPRSNKTLPSIPAPPLVPPKEYAGYNSPSTRATPRTEFDSWTNLANGIVEDNILPDSTRLDLSDLHYGNMNHGLGPPFHHY